MPNLRLQQAIKAFTEPRNLFDISTREDVVLDIISPGSAKAGSDGNETPLGKAAELLVTTVEGGLESSVIASKASDYSKGSPARLALERLFDIYTEKNAFEPTNKTSSFVGSSGRTAQSPERLSVIQIKDVRLMPAMRDVNGVTLFMNSIPTIEMSRCVPFLTIQVQTNRPPVSNNNRVQAPSLIRFLQGAFDVSDRSMDRKLADALAGSPMTGDQNRGAVTSVSGMELFTAPQTLVDPDPTLDQDRAVPVIDRFRPLLSIDRFHVSVTPQVGFFAYRAADLDLTLHDRSRMSEIADFIKPDLYSNTELLIEYGWSHPDDTGENAFGTLINAMRSKEKYGIVNSSFSFTKTGEVKVKLKLFTKAFADMRTVRLGEGGEVMAAADVVRALQNKVADFRRKVRQTLPKGFKEVRGEQQLFASAEDVDSALELTRKEQKQLRTYVKNAKGSHDVNVAELGQTLGELFGARGRGGKASSLKASLSNVVRERMAKLKSKVKSDDPFLVASKEKLEKAFDKAQIRRYRTINTSKHVSFGKLMSTFVGVPLAATGKYDDVQLIFYPFNANAAAASKLNISEFVLDISELRKSINALAVARRGLNVPLHEFVQFIMNNFIDDMSSFNYGLKDLYRNTVDAKTGVRGPTKARSTSKKADQAAVNLQQKRVKALSRDGIFKMPTIDIIIETVPGSATEDGQSIAAEDLKTILKIHFIDRSATPYEMMGQMILASREESLDTIGSAADALKDIDASNHKEVFENFKKKAASEGLIKIINDDKSGGKDSVFEVAGGVQELKRFLTSNIPTLVYGTNNTGIKDASFQTIQEPLLSTVHMLKAGQSDTVTPEGLAPGNLPLRTLPSRATVTTFGCPLIHYMQQFFVDFGTGTTIDNIYGVNKLDHEIAPGKFDTKMELVPLDAYGRYESLADALGSALQHIKKIEKEGTEKSR